TLDEHDQDPLRLLAYLAGAVEHAAPGALPATLDLLNAPRPAPLYTVLEAFLAELAALPGGLTLVLDDYHALSSAPVHQLTAYLLRHLPPACRLALISRTDPPLPLARLRAERQLAELRAADLRFTPAETVALLTALEGAPPDPDRAAALHQQTEGWPIALHLAALARADGRVAGALSGRARRQIAEYLAEEVLARQPADLQAALPALAVPERFCAGLAAALLGASEHAGERLLERLEGANLFLMPLDGEGRWHRFHALFRDLLQRRLRQ
ncbi:MAG: helix-turn-helix transcriptional regulator, partial [Chloroflexaceae bacterium]|nr:helix-turn-helix transcriptional regulator [Chloroflexaceae bacterium]